MEKKGLLVLLLLLPLGCGGERSNVQAPPQLSYGAATPSNANMNFQPLVVIGGGQPLGKDNLVSTLMMDIEDQGVQLSVLEQAVNQELTLSGDHYLVVFPPPLNTSAFAAMRVAYPKEFLELDDSIRTRFMIFYRELDGINSNLVQRNAITLTALSNRKTLITKHDNSILEGIIGARAVAKTLKR